MTAQSDLADRIRNELTARSPREVPMFGGISFMVDDRIVAAARREGDLLLRIDPTESARLLAEPGAHAAIMGKENPMGAGWISIETRALEGSGLATWLEHGMDFHASQART